MIAFLTLLPMILSALAPVFAAVPSIAGKPIEQSLNNINNDDAVTKNKPLRLTLYLKSPACDPNTPAINTTTQFMTNTLYQTNKIPHVGGNGITCIGVENGQELTQNIGRPCKPGQDLAVVGHGWSGCNSPGCVTNLVLVEPIQESSCVKFSGTVLAFEFVCWQP